MRGGGLTPAPCWVHEGSWVHEDSWALDVRYFGDGVGSDFAYLWLGGGGGEGDGKWGDRLGGGGGGGEVDGGQ